MKIGDNFKNIVEKARNMTRKEIDSWRYTLIFFIVVDIFGIYWFLHQRKLGIALLVVFLIGLGIIMFLESKLPPLPRKKIPPRENQIIKPKEVKKMTEEETKPKESDEKEVEEEPGDEFEEKGQKDMLGLSNLGLGSSDDFNERMDKAFEFKGF